MKTQFTFSPQRLFLLHLTLLLSAFLSPWPSHCGDLIEETCKTTPFYDLCVSSLRSGAQIAATDVKALATIMANVVLGNATDTLSYIQGLIKQSRDLEMEHALANCAELYIPVVKYNIPQAIEAVSKGEYGFANYAISDAAKQADKCEKGFSGSGSTESPLTERNKLVQNLCDVAVAILKQASKGG